MRGVEGREPDRQGLEQAERSFVDKLLQGEVVFLKQLTLRELLHIKPGEGSEVKDLSDDTPFGLELKADKLMHRLLLPQTEGAKPEEDGEAKGPINDVPFNFEVRDLGDSFLHIVSFSEAQPVSLRKLFPLLRAAKPGGSSRAGQGLDGISADWRIILPEVRERETQSKELYDFHKKYVPEFSEFEANHFELFWKVLESGIKRRKDTSFFNQQLNQFIDEREFFARYGKGVDFSSRQDIQGLDIAYSEYFKPFLEEKGFIPANSDPRDPDPFRETRKLFYSMNEQQQRALVIEFYNTSVDKGGIEVERKFGRYLRWDEGAGHPAITTLIGEDGKLSRIDCEGVLKPLDVAIKEKGRDNEKPDSFVRLDNEQIELKKGESFVRMSIVKGEDGYKKVKLEGFRLSAAETMVPLIVWQTDKQTGKRSYYCGRLDQSPKHDTLLGQLVVAAYSPQVRDQIPLEIKMKGINGEEKTQQMLEAQAILLVPRYSNQFLMQSPVILGLEALASQGLPLQS